jgi:glycosyltransferase involved in cell wall biosynthesis
MLAVQSPIQHPIVYSHNDWKWRIKQHRTTEKTQKWYDHIKYRFRRRQEEKLVQEVAGCVAASASEAEEIRPLNPNVFFLPTTYSPIPNTMSTPRDGDIRVVHLGGMQTTANRLGLERFLDLSWPLICQSLPNPPALWIVGSLDGASNSLRLKLEQAKATCTGFIEDLTSVLRPNDIHIIPWEYNTGTRTRIPLLLNHRQVLLSTRAAAACLPELINDENSVLVEDLAQMAAEIVELMNDPARRQRLAWAGRQTFERHYTREAIQPRFNQFLQNLITD